MKRFTLSLLLALLPLQAHAQLPDQETPTVSITPTGYNLDWHGHSSRTYFVECSADLINWIYMPVIESGADAALGYGFYTAGDKFFLRLHYTDIPTSNPNSDDFDDDGVSNWDEVRIGGTGTDPFKWDTEGDGKSDYFSDSDNNTLADGWEIQHYGSIGTADPNANDDEDTLSNYGESLMGSDPNNKDTDGDGLNDDEEAVWWDEKIKWSRSAEVRYAVLELSGLNPTGTYVDQLQLGSTLGLHSEVPKNDWGIQSISNSGHVLLVEDKRGPSGEYSALNPANITGAVKNHIWNPATGTWSLLKNDQITAGQTQAALAVGTATNKNGITAGYAWIPLEDSNGDPATGPGVERVSVKWADTLSTTLAKMMSLPIGTPHSVFSADGDSLEFSHRTKGIGVSSDGTYLQTQIDATASYLKFGYSTISSDNTKQADFYDTVMTSNGDVFYKDPVSLEIKVRPLGGQSETLADQVVKPSSIKLACRIPHATNTDVAAYGDGLWARTQNAWSKVKPHPITPLTGVKGISADLTLLLQDGKSIMKNGRIIPLTNLMSDSKWSNLRMGEMNDHGVIVGRALKSGGGDEIIMLVPIQILMPRIVNDVETGDFESSDRVGISKIYSGFPENGLFGSIYSAPPFSHRVNDRFYVKVPKIAGLKVNLATLKTPVEGLEQYLDDSTEIEMVDDTENPGYQISVPQLLVTSVEDDEATLGDLKNDNQTNDNTHRSDCVGPLQIELKINDGVVSKLKWNTALQYHVQVDQAVIIPDQSGAVAIQPNEFPTFFDINVKPHFRQVNILTSLGESKLAESRPVGMQDASGVLIQLEQNASTVLQPIVDAHGTVNQEDIQMFVLTSFRKETLQPIGGGNFEIQDSVVALAFSPGAGTDPQSKFTNTIFFQTNHIHPIYQQNEDGVVAAHELAHVLTAGGHYSGDWERHNILQAQATLNRPTNSANPEFFQCKRFLGSQERAMQQNLLVHGPYSNDNTSFDNE